MSTDIKWSASFKLTSETVVEPCPIDDTFWPPSSLGSSLLARATDQHKGRSGSRLNGPFNACAETLLPAPAPPCSTRTAPHNGAAHNNTATTHSAAAPHNGAAHNSTATHNAAAPPANILDKRLLFYCRYRWCSFGLR
jgi:hypothetical protein